MEKSFDIPVICLVSPTNSNGFERSGVMVTVKSELERIAITERIDVFSTVKKLRDQHEHMLKNKVCGQMMQRQS